MAIVKATRACSQLWMLMLARPSMIQAAKPANQIQVDFFMDAAPE